MPHLVSAFRRASSPVGPILIAVAVVGVAALLWKVADVFMIAFGAILVAATLRAAMDPVMRWSGMRERWALLTVVAVLLLVGSLLSWQFGRQAAQQFAEMRVQLPEALEKFQVWLSESKAGQIVLETVKKAGEEGGSVANAGMALGATLNGVGDVLLILVVGIYLAADPRLGDRVGRSFLRVRHPGGCAAAEREVGGEELPGPGRAVGRTGCGLPGERRDGALREGEERLQLKDRVPGDGR